MPPTPRRGHRRPTPSERARDGSLRIIHVVAIVDAVLLAALLLTLVVSGGAVSVVGPIYLLGLVYLVYLAAIGAMRGLWGWWFAGVVLVTAGLGALPAEARLRREL
jgi:hypothetical protein